MLKKYSVYITVILVVMFLGACGSDEKGEKNSRSQDENALEISEDELVPDDEIIAVINGTEVSGKSYNLVYAQLKLHAIQIGQEADPKKMKKAAYNSVIDRELLIQQAGDKGIEITDEAAGEEFDKLKSENEQGLKTILEQYQMSEDDFKEQLRFELTLNEFKQTNLDISVSDEDIEAYYKKAKEDNEDIPALEEIKPQLKAQIEEQKTNEELQKKIDDVKKTAKIEKKMEV